MSKPLVMLGGGGHAQCLTEMLLEQACNICAFVSPVKPNADSVLDGILRLESDDLVFKQFSPEDVLLVNGIGPLPGRKLHRQLFESFQQAGYHFASVVSPHAILAPSVILGNGVQVMPGVIVQSRVTISDNTLLNTGSIIEHDSFIGKNNHIAPGAVLSGGVCTENNVHVGTGANVIQGLKIGESAVIGAGTTIARDVPPFQTRIPAPSRILTKDFK